jgi:hypothetical protein
MEKKTNYPAAALVAFILLTAISVILAVLALLLWLLVYYTFVGVLIVSVLAMLVGGAVVVQYLDSKYGWFDLDSV